MRMESWEEMQYMQDILSVLSNVYPVIVSANLTQNTYMKLEYQPVLDGERFSCGVFDDLVSVKPGSMEPYFEELFVSSFSRKALVKKFLNGKTEVFEEIKQICSDGKEHWLEIHAIMISRGEEDIREICLVRIIDEKKEKELKLREEIKERDISLSKALQYEKLTNECMRLFYRVENLKNSVSRFIELTGNHFQADRAFACEIHKEQVFNTVEYCREGVLSKKKFMQGLDLHIFDCWKPLFEQERYALLENVEKLPEEAFLLKEFLTSHAVSGILLIPVVFEGELRLFLGYDNPKFSDPNFIPMVDTLIKMVLVGINRVYIDRKRNTLTYKDNLTKLWNRTRMNEDINMLNGKKTDTGILFLDVNGLKEMNDNHSHAAGDALLCACARIIKEQFSECTEEKGENEWSERAYRIGGDEFVVWLNGISEEEFKEKETSLREAFQRAEDCSASMGGIFEENAGDIYHLIKKADHLMYEDKRAYYKLRGNDRRKG